MRTLTNYVLIFFGLTLLAGCGEPIDFDTTDVETRQSELAKPGRWSPPAEILAAADSYNIRNVQGGPWVGESGCSGTFESGTRKVREWVLEYWPVVPRVYGYSCRRIGGTNRMSVHGTGRALDIVIPIDTSKPTADSADNDKGDPLANYLLEHADEFGIQLLIWDRKIWSSAWPPGSRLRDYSGVSPHHDHIHMELNPAGAAENTPWFDTPMGPPDFGPCGDPIGPEGGVIDNEDKCFEKYGPADFWRTVDGQGHGESLQWTNAWEADSPSNWARWNIELAEAGRYRVEYYSTKEWAVYDSAQFRVRHGGAEEDIYIDLSAGEDGWQTIGEFDFKEGDDQWVSIYDNSHVSVPENQHIVADAIRIAPPPEPDPELNEPPVADNPKDPAVAPEVDVEPEQDTFEASPDQLDVHGRGGCSSADQDPSALAFLLVIGMFLRRRRR